MLPLKANSPDLIDWDVVRRYEQSNAGIEMKSCWPTNKDKDISQDLVLTHEQEDQRGRIFKVVGRAGKTLGELVRVRSLICVCLWGSFY